MKKNNKYKLKYKNYTHFDNRMNINTAIKKLESEEILSNHSFLPFIMYKQEHNKIKKENGKVKKIEPKIRTIHIASHFDRYVYQYYSYIINKKYNKYSVDNEINNVAVAYRTNLKKSNINFAKEVFDFIKKQDQAYIYVADFTQFFDNLNHKYLKTQLLKVLDVKTLDKKTYNMFKSITRYSYVDRKEILKYLSHKNGKNFDEKDLHKLERICSINDFRIDIKPLIEKNNADFGIVQGSPISGLFANIYMIDFDKKLKLLVNEYNGKYMRYSDDLIVIIPSVSEEEFSKVKEKIDEIKKSVDNLIINEEKTDNYYLKDKIIYDLKTRKKRNLNFLGFSFNGEDIKVRDKTFNKYSRKMAKAVKYYENKNKLYIELLEKEKISKHRFDYLTKKNKHKLYKSFSSKNNNNLKQNYMSYTKRAYKIMRDPIIKDQINTNNRNLLRLMNRHEKKKKSKDL